LTNPAEFELGNIKILGTSGQNIDDIKRYSTIKEQTDIDLIEMTLFYGHIAPTLPDTLMYSYCNF
jgi:DNA polymerase delta subunit 2